MKTLLLLAWKIGLKKKFNLIERYFSRWKRKQRKEKKLTTQLFQTDRDIIEMTSCFAFLQYQIFFSIQNAKDLIDLTVNNYNSPRPPTYFDHLKINYRGQFHHHYTSSFQACRSQKCKKTVKSSSFFCFWDLLS